MAKVTRKPNERFDRLMQRFKKAVDNDDVLKTYQEKSYYEKPTAKRKIAKELAKKRYQRSLKNEQKELEAMRRPSKKG